jgi:TonB family protein
MIFRRLLESYARAADAWTSAEGYAVSFAAHLILVGGWFVGTRPSEMKPEAPENFTPVQYLIPKEQLAGSRPQREQISWVSLDTRLGEGFAPPLERPKDEERLEVVVPRGEAAQIDTGQAPTAPQPPIELGDSIKTEIEVDSAVMRYEDSAAPPYPETLLKRRIEGSVIVQYVVDTTGHADTSTFRVVAATHNDFALSVKRTLPLMRFHPAIMNNHRVAQLVQQPFVFKIVDTTRVDDRAKRPPGK